MTPTLAATRSAPNYQGYLDERSTRHLRGWVRDLNDVAARVTYQILLDGVVLAEDVAELFSPTLETLGVGDATYAFMHRFAPPLTEAQRDRVHVYVLGAGVPLELAPALSTAPPADSPPRVIGYVDERSTTHIAGWMMDADVPGRRLSFRVMRVDPASGEQLVMLGRADGYSATLDLLGVGDARYAFHLTLPEEFDTAARDSLLVRPNMSEITLPLAPALKTVFEPIGHIAMDITDNCNLRCPFCVFDYSTTRRTRFMSAATFAAAARLLPYVADGNFWLSCVHEATLHPELLQFVDSVPLLYRRKLMYTTNLAKRMPDAYFARLAASGLHHINISVESLDPALYERMRKGARFPVFSENWRALIAAFAAARSPPALHYIIMGYRSNLAELPSLVLALQRDYRAARVEVRDTMAMPHIDPDFLAAELLDQSEWHWLRGQLAGQPAEQVVILASVPEQEKPASAPPSISPDPAPTPPGAIPRPLQMRIDWTGALTLYSEQPGADRRPHHINYLVTNINHVANVENLLRSL